MHARPAWRRRSTVPGRAAVAAFAVLAAPCASAQAWLPAKGTLGTALTFNSTLNLYHYLPNGDESDAGHTRSEIMGLGVGYSPSDRVLLAVTLPYVTTRYWGERPHPGEVDDGDGNATLTDLRFAAHFQALREPFALAPYIAYVTPVRDYPVLGHAAPGRGLDELWLGFGIGKNLSQWLPRTYVQGRYNYAFVEEVAGVAHDHSNVDLEIGYFINRRWSVRALCFMQFAHGGVEVPMPPSNPLFPYHDQLAAVSITNAGAGVAYSPAPRLSLFAMALTSVKGENAHKLDQGVTIGVSYGFSTLRERIEGDPP
jgi:hypothetical protein